MLNTQISAREFRDALGCYASGVTNISTIIEDAPIGLTCQSFYSVSIDPPLVSFSVMRTSSRWPKIRSAGKFSINVLSFEQEEISTTFGRGLPDMWSKVEWRKSSHGNPFLHGALLSLDCTVHGEHEAGDHWIIVANVLGLHRDERVAHESRPLLFFRGKYHGLAF